MKTLLKILFSLGFALLLITQAQARNIPDSALKAKMTVVSARVLSLNGTEYTLSVGGIIYNDQNLIVQTQSLTSSSYLVRVQLNDLKQVHRVWILTSEESQAKVKWLGGNPLWKNLLPWNWL